MQSEGSAVAVEAAPSRPGCPRGSRLDRILAWAQRKIRSNAGFALVFGLLFVIAWIPVLLTLLSSGKSFFWQIDGLSQQYAWFVYTGQWIRELLSNVFVTHTFEVPLWTMDSGYGTDVIQSLASTLVNPFYWVSALVPERYAEFAFEFVILLGVWCAGLAFSAWCVGRGVSRGSALVGAIAYVFAGNVVVLFSQPSFIVMLLVFPLLLMGVDRVFARRGPLLFVCVLAWTFLSSFYDAYMACILLVMYCLVQFFWGVEAGRPRKGRAVRLLGWVGVFVGYVVLALLLSCALFLPQVMSLAGADRLGVERVVNALYDLSYYEHLLTGFISWACMGSDSFTGFNALAPIALVLLVLRRRSHRPLLVAFVVLTVMILLPVFGSLMNGLQYPANRWAWAYNLCVAYIIARLLPEILSMTLRERRIVAWTVIAYGAVVLALPLPGRTITFAMAFAVLVGMLALVVGASTWPRPRLVAALACCVVLSGVVTFTCYLSPYFNSWATSLMGVGKSWQFHASNAADKFIDQAAQTGGYDETYRYDRTSAVGSGVHNSNLITGHMSPDYYNSIYNQGIDDFNTSLGLIDTEGTNFRYGSLDSRSMLLGLLGVRYFYLDAANAVMLPETFRDGTVVAQGEGRADYYYLYETDEVTPLAFVTDRYITTEQYYDLEMIDRQHALLQGVVLDEGEGTEGLTNVADDLALNSTDVSFEVTCADGCEMDGNQIVVRRPGAMLCLRFSSASDAEAYLSLSDLAYHDISYRDRYTDAEWEGLGFIGRFKNKIAEVFRTDDTNGPILVYRDGALCGSIFQMNEKDHMYGNKHDWLCNLGYVEDDGPVEITLSFGKQGVYTYDEMGVKAQPMEGVGEQIGALAAAGATDIEIGTNEISCTASSQGDAQLFLSVAYSEGWSATVDGEPAAIHRADLGFMSVDLPAGTHEVRLTYETPYLREGIALTAVGVVATVVTCVLLRRHRARHAARSSAPVSADVA